MPTFKSLSKLILLLLLVAAVVGSAVAFFLASLDWVTALRFSHPWLLYGLPVAGFGVGLLYHHYGRSAEGGNNLILEQIHQPGGGVPRRMAPLVLLGTLATHLAGGSAGREGTAVQMGGSLAGALGRWCKLEPAALRLLLLAGVAAGFGAVFGTPVAGAVFAVEVLTIGRLEWPALPACLFTALAGDLVCRIWGIGHAQYHLSEVARAGSFLRVLPFNAVLLGKVVLVAAACGLVSRGFAEATHALTSVFRRLIPYAPLRPVIGGLLVIALCFLAGTRDYLGLGVTSPDPHAVTILSFFDSGETRPSAWAWKFAFTVMTLSSGFKGGEVTPLFFIGSALGNSLSGILHGPPEFLAALGFVAIFAGATNTPLACTLMGMELFGPVHGGYLAIGCYIAYACSGSGGIYHAQRLGRGKFRRSRHLPTAILRDLQQPKATK